MRRAPATLRQLEAEHGQAAMEYLLVVGAVVVVMAAALAGFDVLMGDLLGHTCQSIDTAATPAASVGSCIATATPAAP